MQPRSAPSPSHEIESTDRHRMRGQDPASDTRLTLIPGRDPATRAEDRIHLAALSCRGQGLGDYCDARRVGLAGRIELFLQACDIVARAHADGVHHGRLSPDNVLVVEDGARVLGLDVPQETEDRQSPVFGYRIVTGLEFRSPEQVMADSPEATASADVYSLGVILHLLLVDRLPHDRGTLEQAREMGMLSWTYDDGPLSLVGRVSLLGARARQIAHARRMDPGELMEAVSGNLSAILGRALQPDPARRYADAGDLARALRKHAG